MQRFKSTFSCVCEMGADQAFVIPLAFPKAALGFTCHGTALRENRATTLKRPRRIRLRCQQTPKPEQESKDDFLPPSVSQNDTTNPPLSSYSRSVSSIAKQLARVRDKYRQVSDEVRELQSSPEGFVLGSDLSSFYVGSTSLIQDIEIPAAPKFWDIPPQYVQQMMCNYLQERGLSEPQRADTSEQLGKILVALRGWTLEYADKARLVFASDDEMLADQANAEGLDAIVELLKMAGFSILPGLPEALEPPCPEALPLGNSIRDTLDPTLFQESASVHEHLTRHDLQFGRGTYFPHIFIATRGLSLVRKSGMLLPQKILAIEKSFFTWIRTPFGFILQPFRSLAFSLWDNLNRIRLQVTSSTAQRSLENSSIQLLEDEVCSESKYNDERSQQNNLGEPMSALDRVRRVVPAGELGVGMEALSRLFLPTFTQEPAHELVLFLFREVIPDKKLIRKEKRLALWKQLRSSIAQAVNPIPSGTKSTSEYSKQPETSVFDNVKEPTGTLKPVSLELFANVPWGTLHHVLPSTFVLPATRDLLRIDAVTFLGLIGTLITYLRSSESAFVYVLLLGSFISYFVRVGFGWRQALVAYNGRIATEKLSALIGRQQCVVDCLASFSAEEKFVKVACVWMANMVGTSPQVVQNDVFGEVTLTDKVAESWKEWLQKRDLL